MIGGSSTSGTRDVDRFDTFTVSRKTNGDCDWNKAPIRPLNKPNSFTALGERDDYTCVGVLYNVQSLVGYPTPVQTSQEMRRFGPNEGFYMGSASRGVSRGGLLKGFENTTLNDEEPNFGYPGTPQPPQG